MSVNEIADRSKASQYNVSKHLRIMREATKIPSWFSAAARSGSTNSPNTRESFWLQPSLTYARYGIHAIYAFRPRTVHRCRAERRSDSRLIQRTERMIALLYLAACFLAYSNGANDNFKGVASLFGSRTCSYKTAISWATLTTFAGSIMSIFLAQTLLKRFSGKGIVPDQLVGSEYFLLAVAIGAGLTVILATLIGFPISTTHALTGAIIGCGFVAVGPAINFSSLGKGFVLPLCLYL